MELVKISFLKPTILAGMLIAPIGLISAPNSYSQYAYTSPSFSEETLPSATEASFSINADGISCSSGGGSRPMFYSGLGLGHDQLGTSSVQDGGSPTFIQPYSGGNAYLSAGAGFIVPIGGRNTTEDCSRTLELVELSRELTVIKSLKDLNLIEENRLYSAADNIMQRIESYYLQKKAK